MYLLTHILPSLLLGRIILGSYLRTKLPHPWSHYWYLYTIPVKQERRYFYALQETISITIIPIHYATDIWPFFWSSKISVTGLLHLLFSLLGAMSI